MTTATFPTLPDEADRMAALRALELLDTPREERFDRITRTASRLVGVPIALITLVDTDRQWFKACLGLGISETPRSASFCAHAIRTDEIMVVPDALEDPRFVDNPLVLGPPFIRFYAGKPLRSPSGHRMGTLCVIAPEPRELADADAQALVDLGAWAELEFGVVAMSRAARERDQLRRRLEQVIDSIPQGGCLLDADQRILTANPALARMAGREAADLLGTRLYELLERDPLPVPGEIDGCLPGNGTTVEVRVSVVALPDPGGPSTPTSFGSSVAVLSDVSDQRAVERLKDEIISVTGHELRTPLTAIRGSLGLLGAGVGGHLDADGTRLLDTAVRNADRLIRLVNDMLDVERLAAGRMPMADEAVDLLDVATSAAEGLGELTVEAGITVAVTGTPAPVRGDRDRLIQVATNLMHNAVKFSAPGSGVEVTVGVQGESAQLTVRDTGQGMRPEQLSRIFERFTQLDTGTTRGAAGSGLGLAIVQGIVIASGGTIDVQSQEGAGSSFTVTLPLSRPQNPAG